MKGAALAALVAATVGVSVRWGSFVAGGPDSYCYLYQAQRWAAVLSGSGPLQVPEPLVFEAPWPDAALTFAPVGHAPSPTAPGAIAPICPAGLAMIMSPLVVAGGPPAAFAVVPFFGVALILAAYAVGSRYGARVGVAAALLTACSPVFLYQVVQPMSDVPAAALWLLALAAASGTGRRHALWSGLATGAAILVRPNLVPLGVPIGLFLLLRPEYTARRRLRAAMTYAAASAPGCLAVAAVQHAYFGSPLTSGYGSFEALFGVANVWPNLQRYSAWLWQTHTPLIALAATAPVVVPGALTALLAAMIAVNVALYLPYIQFEDWSFLRFLLPTLPLVSILVVAALDALVGRALSAGRTARQAAPYRAHGSVQRTVVAVVSVVLAGLLVREAVDRQAFRLRTLESRFERAGVYVRNRLPPNALVLTSWQSGSVRFYGERKTLVWTALDPSWLGRAVAFARTRGYEPYFLLERWEEPLFRERFRGTPDGALDWPPAAEIGGQVRIYRPGDRDRYLKGTAAPTEYAR
jgi:hypothetical protein